MKKYLLLIFSFFSQACDEQVIENNNLEVVLEPLVIIDSPRSGKVVNEIVYIKAKTKNKEGAINQVCCFHAGTINSATRSSQASDAFLNGVNQTTQHICKNLNSMRPSVC